VAEVASFPSGFLRALPPVTRAVLREQRRRLLARAEGRVLDLSDGPDDRLLGRADEVVQARSAVDLLAEARAAGADDPTFDAVVSVLHLATIADLPTELAAIHRVLAPGGRLLFLEPIRQAGWSGRLQSAASPVVRATSGWRVDRDLPLAIRANLFSIVDIERITMPAIVWPVRAFALGSAMPAFGSPERGEA
jgi:SAM-dependent methyltransferase